MLDGAQDGELYIGVEHEYVSSWACWVIAPSGLQKVIMTIPDSPSSLLTDLPSGCYSEDGILECGVFPEGCLEIIFQAGKAVITLDGNPPELGPSH